MMRRASILALLLATISCGDAPDGTSGAALSESAALGKALFSECAICHASAPPDSPEGRMMRTGPSLFGVYGEPAARSDYAYSQALLSSGLVWDEPSLDAFLAKPQELVPGNRMSFAGEPNAENRQAIIEYMKTLR